MNEDFLQYIWEQQLFNSKELIVSTGEKLEVISAGLRNTDAGPDFLNAKIKLNNTLWAGNIEVHIRASDWYRHKHDSDRSYDNVILHVVAENDQIVSHHKGERIPTVVLSFREKLLDNYQSLVGSHQHLPCSNQISLVDKYFIRLWMHKLTIERLERKVHAIYKILKDCENDWEEAFYRQLATNMGFRLNGQPFSQLAASLPFRYLSRHKNNLLQLEAMLFGQAGLLHDQLIGEEYYLKLKTEYEFLRKKFSLPKQIPAHNWKFMRMRPSNFPTVRIAQMAMLIHKSEALFSQVIHTDALNDLRNLFTAGTSAYWNDHYVFNKKSVTRIKNLGENAVQILLINTVVPFLFAYGKYKGIPALREKAIELL
ncbi:MAG TPA: DUF2851 family protein, partial [Bacteroidales bacterium]|nr:DUF2851 family protein [Bacteroidales bacterium]